MTNSPGGNFNPDKVALERTRAELTASGTGDWKALKETIESLPSNGGTLKLSGTFNATSGDDSGEIIVRQVLTIDGNNSAVIDANDKCRIFNLQGPLTLKDITLKRGDAGTGSGGAVYVSTGELTIEGSTSIVPSTGSDEDTPGKNDVYLKDGTMIDIKGALTGAATVALITPEKYRSGTQVLDGNIISGTSQNYKKFKVTLVSTPQLFVGSDGRLTTTQP